MFTYSVDEQLNAIIINVNEDLTGDNITQKFIPELYNAITKNDPNHTMNRIYNMGNYAINVPKEDIQVLAEMAKSFFSKGAKHKVAIVASNELVYGELRVFLVYAKNTDITRELFKSIDDAFAWVKDCI